VTLKAARIFWGDKAMQKRPALSDDDVFGLMGWVGAALTQWQRVEDAHYLFFLKILGAPKPEVCSVIYFSPPTFESRRVMVDRVAYHMIANKEDKKTWKELHKRLETAASQRGKLAHYALGFEIIKTGPNVTDFKLGLPRLEPSKHNKIAELKGETPDTYHLTSKQVRDYIATFIQLQNDLEHFTKTVPVLQPQQGLGLLSSLWPFLDTEATQSRR
jgi:hypothetical protein